MINLLFFIDRFDHERAGTEKQVAHLVRFIDRDKFNLHISVLTPSKCLKKICREEDVVFFELDKKKHSFLRVYKKISDFVKNKHINMIHTFFIDSIFIASLIKLFNPAIFLITSRRDLGYWYSSTNRVFLYFSNIITDKIVANSFSVRENVILKEKAKPSKVNVIYNGVDIFHYSPVTMDRGVINSLHGQLGIISGEIIFGFIANLRPVKRPLDFIQALIALNKTFTSWKAVVLGDGALKNDMQRMIIENNLTGKVFLQGSVENVTDYYRIIDIGVICSTSEGFPNSVLEMIAAGIPVIGSDVGGTAEIINSAGGKLVAVGDIKGLSQAMRRLAFDEEQYDAIRTKYKLYIKQFQWDGVMDQYKKLYLSFNSSK